jgi:hypothetical protein
LTTLSLLLTLKFPPPFSPLPFISSLYNLFPFPYFLSPIPNPSSYSYAHSCTCTVYSLTNLNTVHEECYTE